MSSLDCGLRKRSEFSPCPLAEHPSVKVKRKSPVFEFDLLSWTCRNNRHSLGYILSGGYATAQRLLLLSRPEVARDWGVVHASAPLRVLQCRSPPIGHGRPRSALMRRAPIKRKDIFELKCLLAIDPIRAVYSVPALMGRTLSSVSGAPQGNRQSGAVAGRRQKHHYSFLQRIAFCHAFGARSIGELRSNILVARLAL